MAGAGFRKYIVTDKGGAVDSDWSRGHLGYGHDVRERTLVYPRIGHYNLRLNQRQHSVAASESE